MDMLARLQRSSNTIRRGVNSIFNKSPGFKPFGDFPYPESNASNLAALLQDARPRDPDNSFPSYKERLQQQQQKKKQQQLSGNAMAPANSQSNNPRPDLPSGDSVNLEFDNSNLILCSSAEAPS